MFQKKFLPIFLLFLLTAAFALSGCGGTSEGVRQVSGLGALGAVQVVSREEGSGTRNSFADLLGFADTDSGADAAADGALTASDTDSVVEAVAGDKSAIGYVSMGTELGNNVKTLTVDGAAGTLENVVNGKYALSRPFCLVWSGELNAVEQDFMIYVMGEGQSIVEKSYAPVHNSVNFLSDMSGGTVTIHGSTSAAPLIRELAEEYETINTNASVEITVSDSTGGINDAMQGLCGLGMASRELKDYEKELLDYKVVAYDGIAVIVNAENPLESVTSEELKALFTGKIINWEDINKGRE
ncbi:MAG: substrate-binding domain-containing protein [Oscillospiraceae bacterium]|nr:substrate-binding domain-containing protein [Oscillospiraceae bacterium]